MKFFRAALALLLSGLALAVLGSCKLDANAMRKATLERITGAERIFFLENISGASIDTDMARLAREAARSGYVQIIRYLWTGGADLNQTDESGMSPILIAASRGDLPLIRFLVEIAGSDVRAKNGSKTTTLMLAARAGSLEVCRYLLDRGSNIDAKSIHGMTALMYAASSGNLELTKLLIERNADTQVLDSYGNNALNFTTATTISDYLLGLGLKQL